jgi:hypothetical protein
MKVRITGASNFVNRMFEACGSFQWAREFLKNSMEAGATRVDFGIEWEAVKTLGVYRRTVSDDGAGMSADELLRFFSTLGEGGKKIGGVHDNFGVGAKIAALPWNPEGLVVISYKAGVGSMIWIMLDEQSDEYELVEFDIGGTKQCVIPPRRVDGLDWSRVAPKWAREHGTTIVVLGSEDAQDTVLGNPHAGETDIKGLGAYLNRRFWELGTVQVTVAELRRQARSEWPSGPGDRSDVTRANHRTICGARYYLTDVPSKVGKPAHSGAVPLCDGRVTAEWYLWEGERPQIHSYAQRGGYIAIRYNGELFHVTSHKAHFRWFGVVESAVQQNLTIILEPQHFVATNGRWGVHPDQSRNRLIFSGAGEKGVELPLSDWALGFAESMPEPIREAIRAARGDADGSIDDAEYRKRLQDRFGDRWTVAALVKRKPDGKGVPAQGDAGTSDVFDKPDGAGEPRDAAPPTRARKSTRKLVDPGGGGEGTMRSRPVDVPRYRFAPKENFEREWHLALWSPLDPEGPTVEINRDSPFLKDLIAYHQDDFADALAEDVARIVRAVFGEIAVAKVAHSQKIARMLPAEQLDAEYRSEQALTMSLLGLLAEESLINQRLKKLGRSKRSAA